MFKVGDVIKVINQEELNALKFNYPISFRGAKITDTFEVIRISNEYVSARWNNGMNGFLHQRRFVLANLKPLPMEELV